MQTTWQRLLMDTRDVQLRRAVRKACNWLKRVRSVAVVRCFERHVVELENQLRTGDQHGYFQNIKLVQLEETKKVESQSVRDEEGRLLRNKGRIRERWVRIFRSLLTLIRTCSIPTSRRGCRSIKSRVPSELSPRRRRLPQRCRQWQTQKRWDRMVFPRNY